MIPLDQLTTELQDALTNGGIGVSYTEFLIALTLSFALSLVIGAVYQHTYRGSRYTQDYVHTLVLMGVVVSVVIMVVGDNMARAFGIFAAFSIIRFRRALPEARDVGFIFFAMAVGLTAGAREYTFAVLTTAIVCAAVLLIWRTDLFAPPRTSHLLRVTVRGDMDYGPAFAVVFDQLLESATLVSVRSAKHDTALDLRYEVQLKPGATAEELVAQLAERNGGQKVVVQSVKPRRVT
jgi:hypothetical protein